MLKGDGMTHINNRFTDEVIFEHDGTLQEALQAAIAARANLSEANLSRADLSGADLSEANLSGADLSRADLSRADQITTLPIGDPRGYRPVAVWHESEWRIFAGCRALTVVEARLHWGENYKGIRSTGDQYLYAMDWLEKQPSPATFTVEG